MAKKKIAAKPTAKKNSKPASKSVGKKPPAKPATAKPGKSQAGTALPKIGAAAPPFNAATTDGSTLKLADLKGKVVVLYFYPKDDTPGCTKEACGFRDGFDALSRAGIAVVGVSPDSVAAHRKFTDKNKLPFPLLADVDQKICQAYGVWQEKSMYGRTYMGVARTTFVIDRQGRIAQVFEKVKPEGHDAEVLDWVRSHL